MTNKTIFRMFVATAMAVAPTLIGYAQSIIDELTEEGTELVAQVAQTTAPTSPANDAVEPEEIDWSQFGAQDLVADSTLDVSMFTLPPVAYMPLIYPGYTMPNPADSVYSQLGIAAIMPIDRMNWADRATMRDKRTRIFLNNFMAQNPNLVPYNINTLPRPPKAFIVEVDPSQAKITVTEITQDAAEMAKEAPKVDLKRIHWLHDFDASLQFSQAYVSPNWYQGGNSSLNAIGNILYNVKLNPAFHPNLIFETSMQYKLGINKTAQETVHDYNISEDLFQVNSKFGYKAVKRWYYSVTLQFKTQMLNNYKTNSPDLKASFLSPAELNLGVGMTYSYENPRKTVQFTAALSPLSYNLKVCTNDALKAALGFQNNESVINQYGSSAELTFNWKISHNINYFSRLFLFSNYSMLQGDWENTIDFSINKFLSTKLYAHLRYQSDSPARTDTKWQQWQLKEILSIGFSYKFARK